MMGLLFFAGMVKRHLENKTFDYHSIIAQTNQPQFLKNARVEFNTIMSCSHLTCAAMANLNTVKLDQAVMHLLCGDAPFESVLIGELKGERERVVTIDRSNSEFRSSSHDPTPPS